MYTRGYPVHKVYAHAFTPIRTQLSLSLSLCIRTSLRSPRLRVKLASLPPGGIFRQPSDFSLLSSSLYMHSQPDVIVILGVEQSCAHIVSVCVFRGGTMRRKDDGMHCVLLYMCFLFGFVWHFKEEVICLDFWSFWSWNITRAYGWFIFTLEKVYIYTLNEITIY